MTTNIEGAVATEDRPARPGRVYDNRAPATVTHRYGGMGAGESNANGSIFSHLIFALQHLAVRHRDGHRAVAKSLPNELKGRDTSGQGRIIKWKAAPCVSTGCA
jgi:hypothetical protein